MNQAESESRSEPARKNNKMLWVLIIAGVVLTLYGFAETWHHTSKLLDMGNRTAAESAWTRFALRSIGGWVGAGVALFVRSLVVGSKR